MDRMAGGCSCGAVRYEVRGAPVRMLNCHCRDCQRAGGSAFAAIFVVSRSAFEMSGELRYHGSVGSSGKRVERGFCPTCGSPVAIRIERAPDIVALQAASLDDPSAHRPAFDIYTECAQPWDVMAGGTEKFARDWRG